MGNLRLFTSWVSAFVWPLARVNAAMTGQARRVREFLSASLEHAAMWLLAGVCSDVDVECAALNESFLAPWLLALEWSSFRVDAEVSLQVGFSVEGFATRFSGFLPVAWPGARS